MEECVYYWMFPEAEAHMFKIQQVNSKLIVGTLYFEKKGSESAKPILLGENLLFDEKKVNGYSILIILLVIVVDVLFYWDFFNLFQDFYFETTALAITLIILIDFLIFTHKSAKLNIVVDSLFKDQLNAAEAGTEGAASSSQEESTKKITEEEAPSSDLGQIVIQSLDELPATMEAISQTQTNILIQTLLDLTQIESGTFFKVLGNVTHYEGKTVFCSNRYIVGKIFLGKAINKQLSDKKDLDKVDFLKVLKDLGLSFNFAFALYSLATTSPGLFFPSKFSEEE